MPKIAQSDVNDSSLEIFTLSFMDPTPHSITLTLAAAINSPSMYTPTLDPFTADLWLLTNNTFGTAPFVSIDLPEIHIMHPISNVSSAHQVIPVLAIDELTDYAIALLTQEVVVTAMTGTTKLHEGKLPTVSINYNSSTKYKALNGLEGFNATDLRFNFSAPAGTPNLVGNAYIPNPSMITVEMVCLARNTTPLSNVQYV
jgi:hypothetical protein